MVLRDVLLQIKVVRMSFRGGRGAMWGKSLVQVGDVMSNVVTGKVVTEPTREGRTGLEVV